MKIPTIILSEPGLAQAFTETELCGLPPDSELPTECDEFLQLMLCDERIFDALDRLAGYCKPSDEP